MWSSAPPSKEEDWPMESSPPPQLTTDLHPSYSHPPHSSHPSLPVNPLSETSSVSSNDSCQMDVTCLQRLHFDVDKRPFPSILPLVQPMETLHEERFSPKESVKDDLDLTHFWVGSARASVAVSPTNQQQTFFFNIISPSPVTSPLQSPYVPQSGGFATQERVSTVSTETLVHEHRSSQSSLVYSGQQQPLLQSSPSKDVRYRDSAQTLTKGGQGSVSNRSSSAVINAAHVTEECLVVAETAASEREPSSWKRMFKRTVRKDTIGSKESVSTLYSSTATVLNRDSVQESGRDSVKTEADLKEQCPEKKPKGFKRFLKKTTAFFRSSSKSQKKPETVLKMDSKLHGPGFNLSDGSNSALYSTLSSEPTQTKNVSPPSTLTKSSKKDSNSSATTLPQGTPRKSPFGSVDNESRDQTRLKPTDSPIVSNETMESLDRGRMTWKLMGQTSHLKAEYLYATALAKNESLLASYNSSLLHPSNPSSSCGTGGCGAGSHRDYYASSDGGESRNASMDRLQIPTATDSGTKTASNSHLVPPNTTMQRNHAGQCRAGNGLASLDPRLSLERPDSTKSMSAAEKLETNGRSRSSPAIVISIGGFQDLKLTVGVELAKLYYDICVSGLDVDEIAERAASGEYLNDEDKDD
ncbi:hypothetical protein BJ741DRAFT_618433 [Chytriomyces cf. hyalinus JEL632]|nr:hypothetical protein BJ741DRAFT_618433 [Chytriomyces cf. hyalinus JEL632]